MHKLIYVNMLQSFLVKIRYAHSDFMKRLSSRTKNSSKYQKLSVKNCGRIEKTFFAPLACVSNFVQSLRDASF